MSELIYKYVNVQAPVCIKTCEKMTTFNGSVPAATSYIKDTRSVIVVTTITTITSRLMKRQLQKYHTHIRQ